MSVKGFPPIVPRFPITFNSAAQLVPLFRKELELCKIREGETIILFSDPLFRPHYTAAFTAAALELGAEPISMVVPTDDVDLNNKVIEKAWAAADMIIGMTTRPWLYTQPHDAALESGARTLMVHEPEDCLRRMFPHPDVRRRAEAGAEVLSEGNEMRVTSNAGTDLVMDISGRPGNPQYGYTDQPGRWDHWPGGLAAVAPIEGSVEGILVVDKSDIIFRLGRYVEEPIHITIKDGGIVDIEGGTTAILLSDYLAQWEDEKAYIVSHIGWGCEHRANWNALGIRFHDGGGVMDAETYLGNMQIAFGSNFLKMLGGKNVTAAHIDIPCRNHTIFVDDRLIVENGKIVPEELQ
jgi:2,5-dihydroxypyridine 5,6-dioxygenase